MSKTIDERVVSMQFDNKQFESNVKTSMSTIEKLKRSLNFTGAAKGLENINSAANKVNMSPLSSAVDSVKVKFSAFEVVAVTALANITNSAINAGTQLIKSLSVDQIIAGWNKYEQKTASVQTIMNATGKSIDEVNKYLDKLMWFSDETSYGFTDMTAALAQMTASGGNIDNLIPLITGVANATAYAGKGATEFSRAMYNLNQSYGSGYLQYMDWKSLELAGVASKELKQVFIDTAVAMGKIKEGEVTIANFGQTLKDKWADTSVMEAAFGKFSELSEEAYKLVQSGEYDTASEAIAALSGKYDELAVKAFKSAQEAKSFTEAIEATKDAVSSGWLKTFEIIFGNYEEAKVLWTDLANNLWDAFASGAEARNEMLQGWKDLGGRDALIESFWNTWKAIGSIITPIKEAFRDIFPPVTAEQLVKFTEGLRDLTEKLKLSDEMADKFKRTFKGIFSFLKLAGKLIIAVAKPILALVEPLLDLLLSITAPIGDFFTALNEGFDSNGISGALSAVGSVLSNFLGLATDGIDSFAGGLSKVGEFIGKVATKIGGFLKDVFGWIADNVSAGDIFAGLAGGGIFVAAKKFSGLIKTIKDAFLGLFDKKESTSILSKFSDILTSVHDSLKSFSTGIKVGSIVAIAVAVGILSASLKTISQLDAKDIGKSLAAIAAMLVMLSAGFRSLTKSLSKFSSKGVIKAGISLILIATAIRILASAMAKIAELSMAEVAKGLFGIGVGLAELSLGLKIIGKTKVSLSTSIAMIALAESCKILGDAMQKFATLSWGEIARGLTAMGGALLELTGVMAVMKKVGGGKSLLGSASLLIAVQSLEKLAEGLQKFGAMSWQEIGRGLAAMGGALAELSVSVGLLGKLAGFSGILGAGAILIVTQALEQIANSLVTFAAMSWTEIGRGLTSMGGALAELSLACGLLGGIAGFSAIFGAGAILIVTQALEQIATSLTTFGLMSWDEIGRGLSAMGGALTELSLACGLLGGIAGFSSIFGAGAIMVVVQGLDDIANALQKFGSMMWDEIGRGLAAMGGALTELSLTCGLLGGIAGFSGLFGAGSILIVVQGLYDLANALQKFGSMAWDEIGRGLVAMGGALTELAVVTGVLGTLAPLASLIGSGSLLLAVQGLGDLADALKKFGEMDWDSIGRGLTAMAGALGEVALGGLLNTLSGLGALSIATIAEPLGQLADSVKKWAGVEVPSDLAGQLSKLAEGILAFTFGGSGAASIAIVAGPLGVLANSVKNWTNVTIPDGLGAQLKTLAEGIKHFTFGEFGASAIAQVASPLGTLANSVKKWTGVTVPENLEADLKSLSSGIKSFTWAFVGGLSLSTIIDPLSKLPDAVKKWNGVEIPDGLEGDLKGLASAINSFALAFVGAWSISTVISPIKNLAEAVKKWNDVTVPTDLGKKLTTFAKDIKTFATDINSIGSVDTGKINSFSSSVTKLSGAMSNIHGVNIESVKSFVSAIKKIAEIKVNADALKSAASAVSSSVKKMMDGIKSAIKSGGPSIDSSMKTALSGLPNAIKSSKAPVTAAITSLISGLTDSVKSKKTTVSNAFKSLVSGAAGAIKEKYSSFESAGRYLGDGLVSGINSKVSAAYNAGFALGQAAVQGEKDGQKSNSPSKLTIQSGKWLGEGLIIGIKKMGTRVYNAGYGIGEKAVSSISRAISNVQNAIDSGMDTQPTIRPVLDLSDVTSGASLINSMFGITPSVGLLTNVGTISSMMNRSQNGANDDVISAINDLGRKIANSSGDTYSINGITYDDGSNISDAVKSLVRAARVERRI